MNSHNTQSSSATATLNELSTMDKHCLFRSGTSWFSVPATSVREIAISPELVRVPHCDPALAGICHLRSEFIPVISLNDLLRFEVAENTQPENKLIVIKGTSVWALQIAEAAAIESLETMVAPESRMDETNQSPVMGTAMFRDQIVRVLDPNEVLRLAKQTLENLWNHSPQPLSQTRIEQRSQG